MNNPDISALSCADDYDPNSLPVDKARALIATYLQPLAATETLTLKDALGRVLAQDIVSPLNVPAHDNSAMDGYALRHADLETDESALRLIGASFAGQPFAGTVAAGQCVRIMTGAVIPDGADTVVMQEHATVNGNIVRIGPGHRPGQNLRRAGEDLRQGAVALARGKRLRPAELGLIASLGIGQVSVYRKLRVAFFSTGDELRSIGSELEAGQIYDSNRYTLHGMLTRLNVEAIDLGVVPDDPAQIERTLLTAAAQADVVISSGGVSVGEADYVKELLNRLGTVVFWKIAMKPGRPLAYGKIANAHFFGLPGNPVAVMTTFYQFVREALLKLMGLDPVLPLPTFRVPCTTPLKKAPGRTEFQRGILEQNEKGEWSVRATGDQGSGILSSMSQADCFIILPTEQGKVAASEMVEVQMMEGLV
ncbi:MAG: molybdopterin molybdotransferase MoeA [Pseudomonadota bacterium]